MLPTWIPQKLLTKGHDMKQQEYEQVTRIAHNTERRPIDAATDAWSVAHDIIQPGETIDAVDHDRNTIFVHVTRENRRHFIVKRYLNATGNDADSVGVMATNRQTAALAGATKLGMRWFGRQPASAKPRNAYDYGFDVYGPYDRKSNGQHYIGRVDVYSRAETV